jgi:hypothetical protein
MTPDELVHQELAKWRENKNKHQSSPFSKPTNSRHPRPVTYQPARTLKRRRTKWSRVAAGAERAITIDMIKVIIREGPSNMAGIPMNEFFQSFSM